MLKTGELGETIYLVSALNLVCGCSKLLGNHGRQTCTELRTWIIKYCIVCRNGHEVHEPFIKKSLLIIYKVNIKGPRIDPCGIRFLIVRELDSIPSIAWLWALSANYEWNQLMLGRSLCMIVIAISCLFLSPQVGHCLGSKLESLAMPGSSITEASLLSLLPRLTSLRRLDLTGLDSLFMSGAFLSREEHRQQVLTTVMYLWLMAWGWPIFFGNTCQLTYLNHLKILSYNTLS